MNYEEQLLLLSIRIERAMRRLRKLEKQFTGKAAKGEKSKVRERQIRLSFISHLSSLTFHPLISHISCLITPPFNANNATSTML
jgi:hypothetical protein